VRWNDCVSFLWFPPTGLCRLRTDAMLNCCLITCCWSVAWSVLESEIVLLLVMNFSSLQLLLLPNYRSWSSKLVASWSDGGVCIYLMILWWLYKNCWWSEGDVLEWTGEGVVVLILCWAKQLCAGRNFLLYGVLEVCLADTYTMQCCECATCLHGASAG
jgi:hypothetical protein